MTSTLPPLVQALSGSIGSATANAVSYPLDLVATRLQITSSKKLKGARGIVRALQYILWREGWSGLFDGLGTDTIAQLLSNFLYFYFYSFLRTILIRRKTRHVVLTPKSKAKPVLLSVIEELGIGFVAGVASRAISTPLSVVTVRLQTASEDEDEEVDLEAASEKSDVTGPRKEILGPVKVMKRILAEDGLSGLWKGFTTTIPLSLNPAFTLFFFQLFRRAIARGKPATNNAPTLPEAFFGAAFSNSVATVILYPLMLAKTRLQVQQKEARENGAGGRSPQSMLTVWHQAYAREGWTGIYQGLEAQILKGFVSQGVTMMVKQRSVQTLIGSQLK
ncbi:mitochondrial carrier [Cristinia sonorae]|uniref:Mitochondrial carrier n=1 Tax=Cristinia sonorae TaxID=1940300 RepID=A0A8K0UUB6_9AGAR|nr:mitochondrial carrier [Cristinia sonorae]